MTFTLKIFSFDYENLSGLTVEASDIPWLPTIRPKRAQLIRSSQPGSLTARFNGIRANRNWFFWIRYGGKILWRSGPILVTDSNQVVGITLFQISSSQTTFSEDEVESQVELPISRKVFPDDRGSRKYLTLNRLSFDVRSSTLRLTGEGEVGDREDSGTINRESGFTLNYEFRLNPVSNPYSTNSFVSVISQRDPVLVFDNWITGSQVNSVNFISGGSINRQIRKTIESELNSSIRSQIDNHLGNRISKNDIKKIVIVVQDVNLKDRNKIEFIILLSMPSELFVQQISEGCRSFG